MATDTTTSTRAKAAAAAIPADLLDAARRLVEQADRAKEPTHAAPDFTEPITIHVLRDGFTLTPKQTERPRKRGETLTVAPDDVTNALWTSRTGEHTLRARLDEGVTIGWGPFPAWKRTFDVYGGQAWREQRAASAALANSIKDPERREAAQREVIRYYGIADGSLASAQRFYLETIAPERQKWEAEHPKESA